MRNAREKTYVKELILLIASTVITIVIALLLIRWLQPSLLGLPSDMVLVSSSKEIPPYYDTVFNMEDIGSDTLLLPDPYTKHRARQLYPDEGFIGPHDILGFRNLKVPNHADIVVIGDSMTYGNNVPIWESWPYELENLLPGSTSVYNMATGGWGAIQYYYMFIRSQLLKPEMVIVAFYTGNDSLESFSLAYAADIWKEFQINPELDKFDAPVVETPPPKSDHWEVNFSDGVKTIFTPALRRASIKRNAVTDTGYNIMLGIAGRIAAIGKQRNIKTVFTIIPTKEYVYSDKILNEKIPMNDEYSALISEEKDRISQMISAFQGMEGVEYIDITSNLKNEALKPVILYPEDINGHPLTLGYRIIAETITNAVKDIVKIHKDGLAIVSTVNNLTLLAYIRSDRFWIIDDPGNLDLSRTDISRLQRLDVWDVGSMNYKGSIMASELKNLEEDIVTDTNQ